MNTPKKSHKPAKPSLAASARVVLVADYAAACDRHDYATARKLAEEAARTGKPFSAGMLGRLPRQTCTYFGCNEIAVFNGYCDAHKHRYYVSEE